MKQGVQANVRILLAFATALVMATLLSIALHGSVSAVTNTANTLKVSPVRSDIQILPGETKTVQTTVTNLTGATITVRPIENDFTASDERGTPALILDADEYAPTHSLKRFMTPLQDVTIPAGQARNVNVIITVPASAQAGGYYGAIRFAPTSPDGGGQVNLSASVASLILLTVPGDVVEKLNLTDFDVQQKGSSSPYFRTTNDIAATLRFENKGNLQIGPFGKISVKKGDKVIYSYDFNTTDPRDVILPDTARRWDIPLDKLEGFGKYTVIASLAYGQENQTVEAVKSFWIVPTAYIIGAAVVLVILVGGTFLTINIVRRRNKRIARRSNNRF